MRWFSPLAPMEFAHIRLISSTAFNSPCPVQISGCTGVTFYAIICISSSQFVDYLSV